MNRARNPNNKREMPQDTIEISIIKNYLQNLYCEIPKTVLLCSADPLFKELCHETDDLLWHLVQKWRGFREQTNFENTVLEKSKKEQ